jgi:mxaJ protein
MSKTTVTCAALAALMLVGVSLEPVGARAGNTSLKVCADPNNLPFSNQKGQGFENALAELIARDLGQTVEYTWWPQRRGFVRNTLKTGACDVVMGVPADYELTLTTRPYYRSTYVFVSRREQKLGLRSLDDVRLHRLQIGVHIIGDDYSNVPPAHALTARGIVDNVHGFSIYGDYARPDPPRALIDAVARGEIDVAIAWGPLAGYFAQRERVALETSPVHPQDGPDGLQMTFDIAIGVRRDDLERKRQLDGVLTRRAGDVHALLASYGVPLVGKTPGRNAR